MTTILVTAPRGYPRERSYICEVLLGQFLGLAWDLKQDEGDTVRLSVQDSDGELELPDVHLSVSERHRRSESSLPKLPLRTFQPARYKLHCPLVAHEVPIIYGADTAPIEEKWRIRLPVDIFGSAFFMLSRYEELVCTERDKHDRFPALSSIAYKAGFLERPIVDEYVEILWAAMHQLWPGLSRQSREGRIFYTCDVDHPYQPTSKQFASLTRAVAGDIIKRREPAIAMRRIRGAIRARRGDFSEDTNNTFDWIMDLCETHSHRAAFYFICGHSAGAIDGCYDLDEPFVRRLMTRIHERGHEIGVHGSYNSFCDAATLQSERQNLLQTLDTLNIKGQGYGARQHYLRWDSGLTPSLVDTVGFEYDTTGSFADRPGFRYGTSKPFPMWDWQACCKLNLLQRPLIAMEASILEAKYLGLTTAEEQVSLLERLKRACLDFEGDFCILWHNNRLSDQRSRDLLITALSNKTSGY